MVSSIGQSNNVQRFSAVNALKSSSNILRTNNNETNSNKVESDRVTAPKSLLDRIDTADVRKFAGYVGEYNISDEDIKYGLLYGRSVIAEYLC